MDSSWIEWTACAVAWVAVLVPGGNKRRGPLLGLVALGGAWIFGTATWLLFPAVSGILALLLLAGSTRVWRWGGMVLALGGLSLSVFLCWLFPLPESPVLSGPFATGSLVFELVAEGAAPPLVVQVWYPARKNEQAPRLKWLPDPALAPHLPFHRIGWALARSQTELPPVDDPAKFPVIFYEHSWTGHRAENVAQMEDLASRGFVVVAVDHPGQATRVLYRNGEVIVGKLTPPDLTNDSGVANFEALADKCLQERTEHLERVRRALASGAVPTLKGRLNLDRMGVFGFSFGGTSALRLCALDPAFHAGANEDGLFLGDGMPRGPFLFFDEEMPTWLLKDAQPGEGAGEAQTRASETRIQKAMTGKNRQRVIMDGTGHEAFSDRIFTCRIPRLARVGMRPAAEVHRIVTRRLGDFFKRYLS
ncbi:MAG: hypothetical protein ABIS50_14210 [Luteolibacter sp.]|uniref:alpha/beta hydrolase family protein n=1 Tax=Luteolibacter sp. TaxID=1962973 RepID=UPI003264B597